MQKESSHRLLTCTCTHYRNWWWLFTSTRKGNLILMWPFTFAKAVFRCDSQQYSTINGVNFELSMLGSSVRSACWQHWPSIISFVGTLCRLSCQNSARHICIESKVKKPHPQHDTQAWAYVYTHTMSTPLKRHCVHRRWMLLSCVPITINLRILIKNPIPTIEVCVKLRQCSLRELRDHLFWVIWMSSTMEHKFGLL